MKLRITDELKYAVAFDCDEPDQLPEQLRQAWQQWRGWEAKDIDRIVNVDNAAWAETNDSNHKPERIHIAKLLYLHVQDPQRNDWVRVGHGEGEAITVTATVMGNDYALIWQKIQQTLSSLDEFTHFFGRTTAGGRRIRGLVDDVLDDDD